MIAPVEALIVVVFGEGVPLTSSVASVVPSENQVG
jgi:hypothetical protein